LKCWDTDPMNLLRTPKKICKRILK
jgi:hypothetical protein